MKKPYLSVLICSIQERAKLLDFLITKLNIQKQQFKLNSKVEILHFTDDRQQTIGAKRNALVNSAKGEFVVFIDDDDDISPEYLNEIVSVLSDKIDAVGITGIMTTDGGAPMVFRISKSYNWEEKGGVYYRSNNHISPIKRSIVQQFPFPAKNYHEDYAFVQDLKKSKLIKNEVIIDTPIYIYQFVTKK